MKYYVGSSQDLSGLEGTERAENVCLWNSLLPLRPSNSSELSEKGKRVRDPDEWKWLPCLPRPEVVLLFSGRDDGQSLCQRCRDPIPIPVHIVPFSNVSYQDPFVILGSKLSFFIPRRSGSRVPVRQPKPEASSHEDGPGVKYVDIFLS